MKKIIQEFKTFITRGNVVDLAVGVIIGGAFNKIVTSLVNDMVMPLVGTLLAGVDIAKAQTVLVQAVMEGDTVLREAVVLHWGSFLQNILDFLVIAVSVFFMVKMVNSARALMEKIQPAPCADKEEAPAEEPGPTQEELLVEIRDLLKSRQTEDAPE